MTDLRIIASVHTGDEFGNRYTVSVDGEYYTVNRWLLAALQDGTTPEELELDPDEDDDFDMCGPDEDSTILTRYRGWR